MMAANFLYKSNSVYVKMATDKLGFNHELYNWASRKAFYIEIRSGDFQQKWLR